MKKGIFLGSNLLLISVLFVSTTFAQDSPQWHLPKGAKARLGKGRITDIAYSPHGNYLAVGTSIGVWIYDVQTGAELDLLTGHTAPIESLAFSPDGSMVASGNGFWDRTLRLWDVPTGQQHTTFIDIADGKTDLCCAKARRRKGMSFRMDFLKKGLNPASKQSLTAKRPPTLFIGVGINTIDFDLCHRFIENEFHFWGISLDSVDCGGDLYQSCPFRCHVIGTLAANQKTDNL